MSAKSKMPQSKTKQKALKWRQRNLNTQAQATHAFHKSIRTHHGHITRTEFRQGVRNLQFVKDSPFANVTQILPEAASA